MATIELPISKSIANRELILSFLSGAERPVLAKNVPDDVHILAKAIYSNETIWDLGHAGTAMRFATALACLGEHNRTLRGSDRMHERPIRILVDALRAIGADISYSSKIGYPPLEIRPSHAVGGAVEIDGSVSSQFISALLLVAPRMAGGLQLKLTSSITSRPYIDLTLDVLSSFGVKYENVKDVISIPSQQILLSKMSLQRDWSAAAFFYGMVAQGYPKSVYFPQLDIDSAQGDRALMRLYEPLGVSTERFGNGLRIVKTQCDDLPYEVDLVDQPDLAQAIAFTCGALGRTCKLTGLHTLRIKETDRIAAIKECLEAVGCLIQTGADWLEVSGQANTKDSILFESYKDHRMAMASSILTPALGSLSINEETVVSKSFPDYWNELERIGGIGIIKT
jgi:3-phosphoshikimate 1-carboxyvinyltransferase